MHDAPEQAERDAFRTVALGTRGIRVIRFSNADVFFNRAGVLNRIEASLNS